MKVTWAIIWSDIINNLLLEVLTGESDLTVRYTNQAGVKAGSNDRVHICMYTSTDKRYVRDNGSLPEESTYRLRNRIHRCRLIHTLC